MNVISAARGAASPRRTSPTPAKMLLTAVALAGPPRLGAPGDRLALR